MGDDGFPAGSVNQVDDFRRRLLASCGIARLALGEEIPEKVHIRIIAAAAALAVGIQPA